MKLKTQHAEFKKEHFVVQRSHARYSLIAKDQSLERSNKEIKTDGGYTNLNVNDPIILLIQTLASPQRAELISEFEEGMLMHPNLDEFSPYQHHEESYAF